MVFCRGCGKEIHETAPTCPLCGGVQNLPSTKDTNPSTVTRILMGFVWVIAFWFGFLFLTGAIVGALNPDHASEAAQKAGNETSGIFLLLSFGLSIWLTMTGKLPGTKKKNQ